MREMDAGSNAFVAGYWMRRGGLATWMRWWLLLLMCVGSAGRMFGLGEKRYVRFSPGPGAFPLVTDGRAVPLMVDGGDWPGVWRAAGDLAADVNRVTGVTPALLERDGGRDVVLIGTIGHSALIDGLVRAGKLDITGIAGHWEMAVTTVVEHPMPGVRRALVIAGADKRGTIYGIYDLSEQIGVSPWTWWADVRVMHRDALYVEPGRVVQPEPAVRYRGIFLNDEAPSLTGWVNEKFGGFNSKFYVHVFELLLRLKANYLWPAMWNSAFNEDDPQNPVLADEYGIVMGTSHHEPMLRAQQEWKRHGSGAWDYGTNAAVLHDFWRKGIERNKDLESTITIGMRGDGDMPMTEGENIKLLEKIVAEQRGIIADVETQPGPQKLTSDPQVWALYKEVQAYYEKGMRVPDDVTLLWCDDNWGNIRRLPTAAERERKGGAGIYYHFDYVGDPRSYKWLNTYSITKVWEQMNLALHYGADLIWVVNVGDLKPMEFPIEFFLTMARTPERYNQDHLHQYAVDWATRDFGAEHAEEMATDVELYTKYNSRRKPEQIDANTYSITSFVEAGHVVSDWRVLQARVDELAGKLPEEERASYFELVQYPVNASANLTEMYVAAGRNALYAKQGRADAGDYAEETRKLFAKDAELTDEYNHTLLNGRWDHMMDQTHIGYTFWNEPPLNTMPAVTEVQPSEVQPAERATVGAVAEAWLDTGMSLGTFDSVDQPQRAIVVFDKGREPAKFTVKASAPWIWLSQTSGEVTQQTHVEVRIDWDKAPAGTSEGTVTVEQPYGAAMVFPLQAVRLAGVTRESASGFVESDGYVAMEAADWTARDDGAEARWVELPGFGETKSGMTVFPVTAASELASKAGLEYRMYLQDGGTFQLEAVLAPTLRFVPGRGLRFAVSVDDGPRTVVDALAHDTDQDWAKAVSDGVRKVWVPVETGAVGYHTLKVWRVDPGVVLERLVMWKGKPVESYLGPPESFRGSR